MHAARNGVAETPSKKPKFRPAFPGFGVGSPFRCDWASEPRLERSLVQFLPLTWTVVHPISESSPLYNKTPEELQALQAEILILIKAFDDTFFQTVHVRHSYRHEEVVWNASFVPAFEVDSDGKMVLDLSRLSDVVPAE